MMKMMFLCINYYKSGWDFLLKVSTKMLFRTINETLTHNVMCICEVRQTRNLNICKPLHGVSCIYAVRHSCFNYDKI